MDSADLPEIIEGDLQAYLEGERSERVVAALARSPELRRELERLEHANQRLHALFAGTNLPGDMDLIDVAAGQATPLQQLRVAAYLRESPAGRRKMAFLLEGKTAARQHGGPLVLSVPSLALGVKSLDDSDQAGPTFLAAELAAQLVLKISPHTASSWSIRGYLDQHGTPLATTRVLLRSPAGLRRQRTTDTGGFFTFEEVPVGSYHLRIALGNGILLTPPINLPYEP